MPAPAGEASLRAQRGKPEGKQKGSRNENVLTRLPRRADALLAMTFRLLAQSLD
jgi:hypothetical protein